VRTVAETPIFQRYAAEVWVEAERERFIDWIAANPEAGDLIRNSGGFARFAGPALVKVRAGARE